MLLLPVLLFKTGLYSLHLYFCSSDSEETEDLASVSHGSTVLCDDERYHIHMYMATSVQHVCLLIGMINCVGSQCMCTTLGIVNSVLAVSVGVLR